MSTRTVSINNSAPRDGVVKGISYSLIGDAPWSEDSKSTKSSVQAASPTSVRTASYTIRETPQSAAEISPKQQQNTTRQTRVPIISQVVTMFKSASTPKADDMSRDQHATDKSAQSKTSAWNDVFKTTRSYSPSLKSLKTKKNASNISVLRDSETSSVASSGQDSPSPGSPARSLAPSQLSVNAVSALPRGVTAKNQVVKRKPVMSLSPSHSENFPPQDRLAVPDLHPQSRFSWSTTAPSEAPRRGSRDTMATGPGRPNLVSHFSWTTIGTSAAPTPHEEIGDPTALPPMPSPHLEPSVFSDPPTQSILSRKRPVQRLDREEQAPSTPRQRAVTNESLDSTPRATPVATPGAGTSTNGDETPKRAVQTTTADDSGRKALPLLPFMTEQQASHVEMLLTQEKNLVMQRRNIERSISDLEKVEHASPLEVSFAAVRDAKRRLEERRETLREVKMEEMDIGIKIARARRREDFGEGEGTLWVRRVTG